MAIFNDRIWKTLHNIRYINFILCILVSLCFHPFINIFWWPPLGGDLYSFSMEQLCLNLFSICMNSKYPKFLGCKYSALTIRPRLYSNVNWNIQVVIDCLIFVRIGMLMSSLPMWGIWSLWRELKFKQFRWHQSRRHAIFDYHAYVCRYNSRRILLDFVLHLALLHGHTRTYSQGSFFGWL